MTEPWINCPECGCGPGDNHKIKCSRGNRPPTPNFSVKTVLEHFDELIAKDDTHAREISESRQSGDQ